ncbi:hypothetical protein ACHAPI_011104 [Fusarium lateritium]
MIPDSSRLINSLGIRLDRKYFVPGDTITGYVVERKLIVCPWARLELCVHGTARSRLGIDSVAFDLLYFKEHCAVLHRGPLHFLDDSEPARWNFSITLPHRVDPRLNSHKKYGSYIPLDSNPELPPSYKLEGDRGGDAFVEYNIRATLYLDSYGGTEEVRVTHPFTIERFHPGPPLMVFELERWRYHRSVKSRLLVPGVEDVKLSLKQSFKQSFSMAKEPQFKFDLYVELPRVIQIDGPTPIPLKMLVSPNWDETSEIIQHVPQEVELVSAQCWIVTHTQFMFENVHLFDGPDRATETDLGLDRAVKDLGRVCIPCATAWRPIDIGEMVNLRIGNGTWFNGTGFPRDKKQPRLTYSFSTFNVQVKHKLRWAVKCAIQGEKFVAKGTSDLVILMPNDGRPVESGSTGPTDSAAPEVPESAQARDESWIRPPDEEPPPTFEEVQMEDLLARRSGDDISR